MFTASRCQKVKIYMVFDLTDIVLVIMFRDGIARCWRTAEAGPKARSVRTYDGHTDWVNDIVLLSNEATIVTARCEAQLRGIAMRGTNFLHPHSTARIQQ